MKEMIKKLFEKWACMHEWGVHCDIVVMGEFYRNEVVGHKRTLICKKCGKIKKIWL